MMAKAGTSYSIPGLGLAVSCVTTLTGWVAQLMVLIVSVSLVDSALSTLVHKLNRKYVSIAYDI